MSTVRANSITNSAGSGAPDFPNGLTSGGVAVATVTEVNSAAVPTGVVATFARNTAPTGWLKANGAAVSRTTYATLFSAIGTTFGVGDGSTTFNLPDLRGEFLRGWDDSRGVDSGRAFGSAQSFAIENISGSISMEGTRLASATGPFSISNGSSITIGGSSASTANIMNFNASSDVQTATETRPRNVALLACIKF